MDQPYERIKETGFLSDTAFIEDLEQVIKGLQEGLICKDVVKLKHYLYELCYRLDDSFSPHYMKFILSPLLREVCRFLEKENASKVKRMIICFYGADKSSAMVLRKSVP